MILKAILIILAIEVLVDGTIYVTNWRGGRDLVNYYVGRMYSNYILPVHNAVKGFLI